MVDNPPTDVFHFLIGQTGDYDRFGPDKFVSVGFYLILLVIGLGVARANWIGDAGQRQLKHVWVLLMRVAAGEMWFQGTIWKLPLPVAPGFRYWLGQEGKFSAIPIHANLARDVLVPHIGLLQPFVYALEILFTILLTLGVTVRLTGIVAVPFTIQLWVGLYNDPTKRPWTYMAIIFAHGMFATSEAGRSLGIDGLIRTRNASLGGGRNLGATVYRLAS